MILIAILLIGGFVYLAHIDKGRHSNPITALIFQIKGKIKREVKQFKVKRKVKF